MKENRWAPSNHTDAMGHPDRIVKITCIDCNQAYFQAASDNEKQKANRLARAIEYLLPCEEALVTSVMES